MDGIHDLGGVEGFGPVDVEPDEPWFHYEWERRVVRANFATLIALRPAGGVMRHAIERMDPVHYLRSSYYEHWLTAISTMLVEAGVVTVEELEARAGGHFPLSRADRGVAAASGSEGDRTTPRFPVGAAVRVREWHPLGHTRAPRYVQGKRGVIARYDGVFEVPDFAAHGGGTVLDPTYSVRFTSRELWGEGGTDREVVCADLWERYLEPDAVTDDESPTDHAHHAEPLAPVEARLAAIEAVLIEQGLLDTALLDSVIEAFETNFGPMNGAKAVARAWVDDQYKIRLLADGTAAIADLGFGGPEAEHLVVVENTPAVHNLVVCTLCSCYPWPVLGLPPNWYKSPPYRSRAVREPRALLAEMGTVVPDDVEIRVWDSSAEVRYLVLPERPAGTEGLAEDELAALVTRDAMIGVERL